ncbi:WecB/TagA/CpsF family glycosyltransferase [Bacillus timonensis]|nr:WecB/TagA/CpsF family glycosyltransferase [Bacillus timonensis]
MEIKRYVMGNLPINVFTTQDALSILEERLLNKVKTAVYFMNAHCYNVAQKEERYRTVLQKADFILNDGIGIELGAKLYGIKMKENMNGTDFVPKLLNLASQKGYTVFLLGGSPGIAEKAANRLSKLMPGLKIIGTHHGYFSEDDNSQVISEINKVSPDILIVGRGVPIQEEWIDRNKTSLNSAIILGVGAFIDFASGRIKRAPRVLRTIRAEWLFRFLLEPKRMWRRYLVGNFLFFYYVIKNRTVYKDKSSYFVN